MDISVTAAATIAQLAPVLFVAAAVSLVEQRRAGLTLRGFKRFLAQSSFWSFALVEAAAMAALLRGGASGVAGMALILALAFYGASALLTIWESVRMTGERADVGVAAVEGDDSGALPDGS